MSRRKNMHILYSVLSMFMLFVPLSLEAEGKYTVQIFDGIYEPSGVVQLANGELIIIEDNTGSPLWVLEPRLEGSGLALTAKRKIVLQTNYDDLEGIAVGKNNDLFLITSHSNTRDGVRKKKREKLLKIDLQREPPMEESTGRLLTLLTTRLSNELGMDQQHPQINIEGLSFDHKKERLLIGLRSPMVEGRSIIMELVNPQKAVSDKTSPIIGEFVAQLDIQGGIRAICYDHLQNRYILANEIEGGDGKNFSALWDWNGGTAAPVRLNVLGIPRLKNIEGVSIIRWKEKDYLLLVCDDGNKKKNKGAHYLIVDYDNLR
jgi:hypothetical protein